MPRSTEIVGEKTNSTGLIIHRIIAYVVLVLLVVVSLFPFYLLIINATLADRKSTRLNSSH